MSNAQMSARVGLFFLLGVALIWITIEALSEGGFNRRPGYEVTARFSNLKELKIGDEVRMAGVRIGTVTDTRLANGKAEALLRIDPDVQINRDSTATIAMAGLLGSNYVALDLGTQEAGFHEPGARLNARDTGDLNTLVAQMGDIGEKIDTAISSISGAFTGEGAAPGGGLFEKIEALVDENRANLRATTDNLAAITAGIRAGEGTLGKLLTDPAAYDRLVSTLEEIKAAAASAQTFVAGAQDIVNQVKTGEGTLGALIYDEEAGDNLRQLTANLRAVSDKLASGEGTLGKLINDDSLYEEAQGIVKKANQALDGLADQGPITALGAVAGGLF